MVRWLCSRQEKGVNPTSLLVLDCGSAVKLGRDFNKDFQVPPTGYGSYRQESKYSGLGHDLKSLAVQEDFDESITE